MGVCLEEEKQMMCRSCARWSHQPSYTQAGKRKKRERTKSAPLVRLPPALRFSSQLFIGRYHLYCKIQLFYIDILALSCIRVAHVTLR